MFDSEPQQAQAHWGSLACSVAPVLSLLLLNHDFYELLLVAVSSLLVKHHRKSCLFYPLWQLGACTQNGPVPPPATAFCEQLCQCHSMRDKYIPQEVLRDVCARREKGAGWEVQVE